MRYIQDLCSFIQYLKWERFQHGEMSVLSWQQMKMWQDGWSRSQPCPSWSQTSPGTLSLSHQELNCAALAVGGGKRSSWPWGMSLKRFFEPPHNSPCFPPFSAGDTGLSRDLVMGADKCDCSCLWWFRPALPLPFCISTNVTNAISVSLVWFTFPPPNAWVIVPTHTWKANGSICLAPFLSCTVLFFSKQVASLHLTPCEFCFVLPYSFSNPQ